MTTNIETTWTTYVTDSVTVSFPYDFLIRASSEMTVWWNDQLLTTGLYTVTGVGNDDGGTVLFTSPLPAGVLLIKRQTPQNQLTDYFEGDAFPADSHEEGLDKLTRMIQDLNEMLSRLPALPETVGSALRFLTFPPPGALGVVGWNANGTALTLFPSSSMQVTVGGTSHIAYGEVIRDVLLFPAGQVQVTAGAVFPAGSIRLGAMIRVMTTLGEAQGLTTFSAGSPATIDRWGYGLERTATLPPVAANNPGVWPAFTWQPLVNSEDVVFTADTGAFDGNGQVRITAGFLTMITA